MHEILKVNNDRVLNLYTKISNVPFFSRTFNELIGYVEFSRMLIHLVILDKMSYVNRIDKYHEIIAKFFNFLLDVEKFIELVDKANLIKYNYSELINEFKQLVNQINLNLFKDKEINFLKYDTKIYDEDFEEFIYFIECCIGSVDEFKLLRMSIIEIITINEHKDSKYVGSMTIKYLSNDILDDVKVTKGLKFIEIDFDSDKKIKFVILERLKSFTNILEFVGINFESDIAVFENAEYGDLKSIYTNKMIPWATKLYLALGICKGMIFLHFCKLNHQNLRCSNVLIDKNMTPKLINFELTDDLFMNDGSIMINWHAPEKMKRNIQNKGACDVYSFGMTLWELAFERIPYENYTIEEIYNHVAVEKKREVVHANTDDEKQEKKLYFETIFSAWRDDHKLRTTFQKIFLKLNEAYILVKQEKLEFKSKISDIKSIVDSKSILNINEIEIGNMMPIPIEDGIIAHKEKNYELAFDCFEYHVKLGSSLAMYWKAYYLYDGRTGKKNIEQARKLFKMAADSDQPDAQLRYAFSLLDEQKNLPQEYEKEFAKYIKLSAYNGNLTAQYNLGDMYIKGKYIENNEMLGKKFINIAAIRNHPKAVDYFKNQEHLDDFM